MRKMFFLLSILVLPAALFSQEYKTMESPIEPGVMIDFYDSGKWEYHVEILDVIDGDTILVRYMGKDAEFGIYGIDAPELDQPYGTEAREFLQNLIQDNKDDVTTWKVTTDHDFKRKAFIDTGYESQMMVNGFAWADRSKSQLYELMGQNSARSGYVGLWEDRNPIAPWDWRDGER